MRACVRVCVQVSMYLYCNFKGDFNQHTCCLVLVRSIPVRFTVITTVIVKIVFVTKFVNP